MLNDEWKDKDLEYPGVEDYHDEAGDVEGAEGGVDDEVRVVEGADERLQRVLALAGLTDSQTCVEAERLIHLTTIISVKSVSQITSVISGIIMLVLNTDLYILYNGCWLLVGNLMFHLHNHKNCQQNKFLKRKHRSNEIIP